MALGCGPRFPPSTTVAGLRVLAIGAERPEIQPGETTTVQALVVDPQGGGRQLSSSWFACRPAPLDGSACDATGNLLDLTTFLAQPGTWALPAPPAFTAPADSLDGLSPSAQQAGGLDGQVVLATSAGGVDAALRGPGDRAVSTARIKVSRSPSPNHNPLASGLSLDGVDVPEGAPIEVAVGSIPTLHLAVGLEQSEVVPILDPQGPAPCAPVQGCLDPALCPSLDCHSRQMCRIDLHPAVCEKHELLTVEWLATQGTFTRARGADSADAGLADERADIRVPRNVEISYVAPGGIGRDPIPPGGVVTLWIVLRDDRYGVSWMERKIQVH